MEKNFASCFISTIGVVHSVVRYLQDELKLSICIPPMYVIIVLCIKQLKFSASASANIYKQISSCSK